jgi:hypothetical protein
MPNNILSHIERRDILRSVRELINDAIRTSAEAERYFKRAIGDGSAEQYDRIWTNIEARMAACEALAEQAKNELAALITNDGFHPQYILEIGKNGLRGFTISETNDNVTFYGEYVDGSSGVKDVLDNVANTIIVSAGDVVKISGTAGNDGNYIVDSGSTASVLELIGTNLADEAVTALGAKIEVWTV